MKFRKSSRCSHGGCVWVAGLPAAVAVSAGDAFYLAVPQAAWAVVLADLKVGRFDETVHRSSAG